MADRIVINTGPCIALHKAGVLDTCLKLPFEFLTTEEVKVELQNGVAAGKSPVDLDMIRLAKYPPPLTPVLRAALDLGEASVLQLALHIQAEWVCIDESLGRRFARALGLRLTGSAGLLVLARKSGLIPSVRPPLKSMLEAGVHLSNDLILAALREAGEGTEL